MPNESLASIGLAGLVILSVADNSPALEPLVAPPPRVESWSPYALIELHVVDAVTGTPLETGKAIAGTSYDSRGWSWQNHTLFDFKGSIVRWPPGDSQGYDLQAIRVEAPGYAPYHTPPIVRPDYERAPDKAIVVEPGEPVRLEVRLRRDTMPTVKLLRPDGEPAQGGQVAIAMRGRKVQIAEHRLHSRIIPPDSKPSTLWEQPVFTKANERGEFHLPAELSPAVVVAAHESGFALLPAEELHAIDQLQLEPWGTIHGQAILAGEPAAGVGLRVLLRTRLMIDGFLEQRLIVTTDQEGRFVVEHATPGLVNMSLVPVPDGPEEIGLHPRVHGFVTAGGVTELCFAGSGRPVVGRVLGLDSYEGITVTCELPGPGWKNGGEMNPSFRRFSESERGEVYRQTPVTVAADGSFRFERVPPEYYHLDVWRVTADGERERVIRKQFSFPMLSHSESDEPHDLGELRPYPRR